MKKYINQTLLSIEPEVSLWDFGKVQAFYVKVKCYPAYEGTDKVLMNEVCRILTAETKGDVELKTYYVVIIDSQITCSKSFRDLAVLISTCTNYVITSTPFQVLPIVIPSYKVCNGR